VDYVTLAILFAEFRPGSFFPGRIRVSRIRLGVPGELIRALRNKTGTFGWRQAERVLARQLQEVLQYLLPGLREDGFGMELDTPDWKLLVPDTHDLTFRLRLCRDLQT